MGTQCQRHGGSDITDTYTALSKASLPESTTINCFTFTTAEFGDTRMTLNLVDHSLYSLSRPNIRVGAGTKEVFKLSFGIEP